MTIIQKGGKMLDIKEYLKQTKTVLITQDAFEELKQRAFAQPEIIHCKHCKHRTFHDNRISSEQCYVCDYWDFDDPQPNGFCNFAERREK